MINIINFMLHSGATFSVSPSDQLNPKFGFIAKLEWSEGSIKVEDLDPSNAIEKLDNIFTDPKTPSV